MINKPTLAIFDVDKTLLPGYSIIDFAKYLTDSNLFKKSIWQQIEKTINQYKNKIISYNEFAELIVNNYAKGIKNQSVNLILKKSNAFWNTKIKTLYPYVKKTFKYLKDIKAKTIMISGSPYESLYPLINLLKFDSVYTTEIKQKNDIFLGIVKINAASQNKKTIIVKNIFSTKKGFFTIGFGDSEADLSFLELVDLPIVVGQHDIVLIEKSKKEQWNIISNPEESNGFSLKELIS